MWGTYREDVLPHQNELDADPFDTDSHPDAGILEQGEQPHHQEFAADPTVKRSKRVHRPSSHYSASQFVMMIDEEELESFEEA